MDHRADIYSLGVVFYEMLTGETPRGGFAPPSHRVQMDVRIDEVVLRALEKQPERRYQTAAEFKTIVETLSGAPASSPTPPPLTARRKGRGKPLAALLVATAVWFIVVVQATLITFIMPESYKATARIRVEPNWQYVVLPPTNRLNSFRTEIEVIRSELVLTPVIDRLNLKEIWGKTLHWRGKPQNTGGARPPERAA